MAEVELFVKVQAEANANADARLRAARPTLADLIRIRDGSDPILTTWFMNRAIYAPEELPFYPYELRRSYVAELVASERDPECCDECDDSCTADVCCHWPINDEVRFYAMDEASAWQWLRGTYRPESIASVLERTVTYREVAP